MPVVVGGFVVAAIILTLPLVMRMTRALPSDLADTLLSAWIVAWDADRFRHLLRGVWDAPIYFPYHDTLAFSETYFGLALFVAPIYWLTADPVLTYNAAFLLSFVVAAVGMYLLARELTGSRAAAFAAGLYFAFGPFRMSQIAHVQMMATGWVPIALWSLHRYFSTRRFRWLLVMVAAWALQTTSNSYVGYFIAAPLAIVAADGLWRSRDRGRAMLALAAAGLVLLAALAPVGAAYYRVRTGNHQVRGIDEIAANSADLRSYIVGKKSVGAWRWLPTAVDIDPERELFPGLFALTLAAIGVLSVVSGFGRTKPGPPEGGRYVVSGPAEGGPYSDRERRRWIVLYGAIAIAAIVLSLGPRPRVWGAIVTTHGPYSWLLALVPGMDGMRVPARFAIVVMAGVSVLLAFGVQWLLARAPRYRPLILAACIAAIVADGWSVPIQTVAYTARGRPEDHSIALWLKDQAPGAVLHLPLTPPAVQIDYQFATLAHGHPVVNGFSGYVAPLTAFLGSPASPLTDFDRFPAAVAMLRSLGVRYVILHPKDFEPAWLAEDIPARTLRALRESGQIVKESALPGTTAFELQPWTASASSAGTVAAIDAKELTITGSEGADRLAFLTDGDPDSRWIAGLGGQDGSSWLRVQLAHAADLARVDLQIAERSYADYPRRLRIEGVDEAGLSHTLYDAAPYPEIGAAVVRDGRFPSIEVALPSNKSVAIWIRQTAATRVAWSVHELRLWRR